MGRPEEPTPVYWETFEDYQDRTARKFKQLVRTLERRQDRVNELHGVTCPARRRARIRGAARDVVEGSALKAILLKQRLKSLRTGRGEEDKW